MITTILATAVVLGVLILVHELGHFWMAKLADIEVPRFSIGLGPKLVGFRKGETEYVISWIPLGGYVKMAGMEEMEGIEGGSDEEAGTGGADARYADAAPTGETASDPRERGPRDFESKSVGARTLVISAGVIMNIVLAFVIYSVSALVWGVAQSPPAVISEVRTAELPAGTEALGGIPADAKVVSVGGEKVRDFQDLQTRLAAAPAGPVEIRFENASPVSVTLPGEEKNRSALLGAIVPRIDLQPVIGALVADMPAAKAGLEPGDRIISVAGEAVDSWQQLVDAVQKHPGDEIPVVIRRNGGEQTVRLTPVARPADASSGAPMVGQIGVQGQIPIERPGPVGAIASGARQTWYWTRFTVDFLVQLVTGHASPRNLGGPILIGKLSGEMARAGLQSFLGFMALLSINLAVFNLLPIPVLDGGHLVFLGIEAVRGKALSLEQRGRLVQVGMVFLVALMVWVVANDVLRLFGI